MKPPTDKNRVARTAAKQRATGRAQARTRSQMSRPGKIAESGTLGYSLAKLAGSIFSRTAPAAAKATVKKAPSMAQQAARKQIELVPVKGRGSYGPGKLQQNAGKFPAKPTPAQRASITRRTNAEKAAKAATSTVKAAKRPLTPAQQGARIAATAGGVAGVGATIALGRRDNGTKRVPANEYKSSSKPKIVYSSGKAPARKKGK